MLIHQIKLLFIPKLIIFNISAISRLKKLTPTVAKEFKRLTEAHLTVIDDIVTLLLEKKNRNRFFVIFNQTCDTTSFITTTTKSMTEWARSIEDETLATILLDRLPYQCQLIQLQVNID